MGSGQQNNNTFQYSFINLWHTAASLSELMADFTWNFYLEIGLLKYFFPPPTPGLQNQIKLKKHFPLPLPQVSSTLHNGEITTQVQF